MNGMSMDNLRGLILAVSSSVFIGSSFIIKKQGLKKAGASGPRAESGSGLTAEDRRVLRERYGFDPNEYISEAKVLGGKAKRNKLFSPKGMDVRPMMEVVKVIIGEIANFTAYVYAPAILVTPLGALSIIFRFNLKKLTYEERKAKLIERLHTLNAAARADSEEED
ncbi:hypothetical protein J1N35_028577 [Gossypium stocksii]|uniref:Probable magnesium transporter n=1 Tax=Gossypium stocksii TaxID=47602 RepID=A0A9D3UWM2_9ROSI|nr:hypothetical protein J1N35_028577 [Gossypium stocksii]